MFSETKQYLVTHRSAILATLVVLQNSHILKGLGGTVISAVVALLGG
jgi:hypothetical protein